MEPLLGLSPPNRASRVAAAPAMGTDNGWDIGVVNVGAVCSPATSATEESRLQSGSEPRVTRIITMVLY